MNNLLSIFAILFLFYILFSPKEQFEETQPESYYIDITGKHLITELPLELKDILELKYINTKKDTTKFFLTKGSYKHSESKNEMRIMNGKSQKYQFLFLKNNTPFSGILF